MAGKGPVLKLSQAEVRLNALYFGMRAAIPLLLFLLPVSAFAGVRKHSLRSALDSGLVVMHAASNGARYCQKAMQLELRNTTADVLMLTVDPALVFRPADTSYQDLILPGSDVVVVAPGKSSSAAIHSFCGKAGALAPGAAMEYTFLKQGDSTMIRVAQYLSRHGLYDRLGQAAIWALTDDHGLEGILDPALPGESGELLAFMEKLTGWKRPAYFRLYEPGSEAGQPAIQKQKLTLAAQFELRIEAPKVLSMGVYNGAGREVQVAFKEQRMKPGSYKLLVRFEAGGAAPGAYFLRIMEGAAVLREQKVIVGEESR